MKQRQPDLPRALGTEGIVMTDQAGVLSQKFISQVKQPRGAAFQAADPLSSGSSRPEGRPAGRIAQCHLISSGDMPWFVAYGSTGPLLRPAPDGSRVGATAPFG